MWGMWSENMECRGGTHRAMKKSLANSVVGNHSLKLRNEFQLIFLIDSFDEKKCRHGGHTRSTELGRVYLMSKFWHMH